MPRTRKETDDNKEFTLDNLDLDSVHKKYTISVSEQDNETKFNNTTKLSDLSKERGTPDIISFLDEAKRPHHCQLSMIDFNTRMDISLLRYNCFWCRHPLDSMPIGCPIRYIPNQAQKSYYSQISRDNYAIKENITESKCSKLETDENNDSIDINKAGYYETDGVFCSFNCCKAYILDNKHNHLYNLSNTLLIKMYNKVMNAKNKSIAAAPHWRILEQYGGELNIIKFRESFNKIDYTYHGVTRYIPKFSPISTLYEENIKF
jgi:hypothetical protein|uniref:MYM-type domain-containing protein n=1 Tax=viral metagenome TaxID=1070528 RepID=A0A6C0J220_9ZZZZ